MKEYDNDSYVVLLKGHKLYVGLDEECYVLQGVNDNMVMKQSVPELDCQHEEAGDSTNVPVECNDSNRDVLIIHRYVCKV